MKTLSKAIHSWASEPRLPQRAVAVACLCWVLRFGETPLHVTAAFAIAFLCWLRWDAEAASRDRELQVRRSLALTLKVAAFAEGGNIDLAAKGMLGHCDFETSEGSMRFNAVRQKTHCLFAARAHVWGNDWEEDEFGGDALSANIVRCLPRFYRFCLEVHAGRALDAFVFELRGSRYATDVTTFAKNVQRVLTEISDADPADAKCMRKSYIGRRGWYFQFAREPLFITTFAPCYTSSHPRYQFGMHPESCFVLFQPEESFLRHDIPSDRPRSETDWDAPKDIRDRIRVNFKRNGREYLIPEVTQYPPANFIVAPMCPLRDSPVEFWRSDDP
jgi:hypothetical protein